MKRILLSLFLLPSIILGINRIDELEQAIRKCDVKSVQVLLKSANISQSDRTRLLSLANDVVTQRRSFSTLFAPSKENLLIAGGGILWIISAALIVQLLNSCKSCPRKRNGEPVSPDQLNREMLNALSNHSKSFKYQLDFLVVSFLGGLAAVPISIIKHFYDYGKLWNNAIAIKYLLNDVDTIKED